MSYRISVRLPDELAKGIDSRARQWGETKSEVVRDALKSAGLWARTDTPDMADLLRRAAAFRARQPEVVDAAALIREVRESPLRLRLRRLTVPFIAADLA